VAKALNCDQGPTLNPATLFMLCEINESRSFDVFEIDGASNRGIDEVRNLREDCDIRLIPANIASTLSTKFTC
jgi:DNA polymerase-3 subunit gamma/tau